MKLYDQNKVGTLIIGFYRCGTHFVADHINDVSGMPCQMRHEICHATNIDELKAYSENQSQYQVAIINHATPKYYLTNEAELLDRWHVINLGRRDKIAHYISHWFWQLALHQKFNCAYQHHGTTHEIYRQHMPAPVHQDINLVIFWLQEQLINKYIPCDLALDYEDLHLIPTKNITWNPNQYLDIDLSDLFVNHAEIKNLLQNFKL